MLDIKDDINIVIVTSFIKYVQASLQNTTKQKMALLGGGQAASIC